MKSFTNVVPLPAWGFCEIYSPIYDAARQEYLARTLLGHKDSDIIKDLQPNFGINKRQANASRTEVLAAIKSAKECKQSHIDLLEDQIKSIQKWLRTKERQVADYKKNKSSKKNKQSKIKDACSLNAKNYSATELQSIKFQVHQKKRRINVLKLQLEHLKESPLKVNSSQEPNFQFVGSLDETNENQICQLSGDGTLKIRIPYCLESRCQGEKYFNFSGFTFPYGPTHINYAIEHSAVSFRFYKKDLLWHFAVTVKVPEVPTITQSRYVNGCIGIDLNPGVIGWSKVDASGNLQASGKIKINLHSLSSNQAEAILSDAAVQLTRLAQTYECPIVVENLDFSTKKSQLRDKGRKYARMLSGFTYSKWTEILENRCNNTGIELIKINPAWSTQKGLVKYLKMYGLSSDTGAALVLARRGLSLSERIPSRTAYLRTRKHVWSQWNALRGELINRGIVSRHQYYTVVNSLPEVNLISQITSDLLGSASDLSVERTFGSVKI